MPPRSTSAHFSPGQYLFIRAHKGKKTIHPSVQPQTPRMSCLHILCPHTHIYLKRAPARRLTFKSHSHNWALTYHGGLWRYFERCDHGHIHQSNHSSHYTKGPQQPASSGFSSQPQLLPHPFLSPPNFCKELNHPSATTMLQQLKARTRHPVSGSPPCRELFMLIPKSAPCCCACSDHKEIHFCRISRLSAYNRLYFWPLLIVAVQAAKNKRNVPCFYRLHVPAFSPSPTSILHKCTPSGTPTSSHTVTWINNEQATEPQRSFLLVLSPPSLKHLCECDSSSVQNRRFNVFFRYLESITSRPHEKHPRAKF